MIQTLSASAALLLSSALLSPALLAQAAGETAAPAAIPGVDTSTPIVYAPQANNAVVPQAYSTQFGNTNNNIPFSWQPTRYQQVFLGSEMPASLLLRGVALRFDEAFSGYKGQTIDVEITLGYTTKDHNSLTTTFASNFDVANPAPKVVFPRQNFKLPDMASTKPTNPQEWPVQFQFPVPFVWVQAPNQNLLIEVVIYGNSNNNSNFTYPLDAASGSTTTRLYASGNPTATTGTLGTGYGHVMCFYNTLPQAGKFETFGKGCPGTGGQPIVALPQPAATQMGNSNNYYGVGRSNMRYQQVFDGSEIGSVPRLLTGHALRMRNATYSGGTQTLEIKLSETTYSPSTITGTFATNITGTETTVFTQKTYNYPPMVPNTVPSKFDIKFKWDVPNFLWKGVSGNHLLIEVINTSTSNLSYFPDAFSGSVSSARVYATSGANATTGTVGTSYGLAMAFSYAGTGSATPMLSSNALPVIGSPFPVDLTEAKANTAAVLLFGGSDSMWGTISLPLGLGFLGAPGCSLYVSPELLFPVPTSASGDATVTLPIPNVSALVGVVFFNQYMVLDGAANGLGLVFTNGGKATVGG